MTSADDQDSRRLAELSANLTAVRAQIGRACSAAGRDPAGIALIAVTKTFPVPDIMMLARLGVTDVGENKEQEAAPKAAACAAAGVALRWHFIGQLQVNKVASVARFASMVHSVDRSRLVAALRRRAVEYGRLISCLVQVSLDDAGAGRIATSPDGGRPSGRLAAAEPILAGSSPSRTRSRLRMASNWPA